VLVNPVLPLGEKIMTNYIVLTGGSRGIGEQTLALFMQQGWQAINISRTPCQLPNVKNIAIDLYDATWPERFSTVLTSSVKQAERICLVHNAASFRKNSVAQLPLTDLRADMEINLASPVALNNIFIPLMPPGSSIVYIGSTLSEQAVANRASYVIYKHAIIGLMRATCQDLAGKNISTCCICPGFTDTTMLSAHVAKDILDNFVKQKVTVGRLIEPGEIAQVIYFCAEHPVINGSVLHTNLGQIGN
jgi:3-oxoacyl-[acyl-carrier protein] reductase